MIRTETELLLIDKPVGPSSFDVIRVLRREYTAEHGVKAPKMGHAGTLDPLASGLMLIGVGKGTKKLNEFIKLPKSYTATVRLGERTSTGDLEGEVLESIIVDEIDEVVVERAVEEMIGALELPVPVFSAVKKNGKALYKKARKGEKVDAPMRTMVVTSAKLHGISNTLFGGWVDVLCEFDVESGVYIRSLAEELGRKLGLPATIAELRRTKVGDFSVENARTVEWKARK